MSKIQAYDLKARKKVKIDWGIMNLVCAATVYIFAKANVSKMFDFIFKRQWYRILMVSRCDGIRITRRAIKKHCIVFVTSLPIITLYK